MERLVPSGILKGHNGYVTCIATPANTEDNYIISGSRDKTAIVWDTTPNGLSAGYAKRSFCGHNHVIQDVVLSKDGKYAVTASWDKSLRLWKLDTGKTVKNLVGHQGDVLSVTFSPDNRQIVSCSRDRTIKVWNALGECKITLDTKDKNHNEWISCVKYSPNLQKPVLVSVGWDKVGKVWDLSQQVVEFTLQGHQGYLNTAGISPDGSICATAGKDGNIMLWNLNSGAHLFTLNAGGVVNALAFSPNRFWLCAAAGGSVKVFDLQSTSVVDELVADIQEGDNRRSPAECLCLAWSADGNRLYGGYTDNHIRTWRVESAQFGN